MIKATGTTRAGKPFVLLGLSAANIALLIADQPISFNLSEIGLPDIGIGIVYGATEDEIADQIKGMTS